MQIESYSTQTVDIQSNSVRVKLNGREWHFTGWKARLISGTISLVFWSTIAAVVFVIYRGVASFF